MGVDSQILGNVGDAHSLAHDGKVYKFKLIDQTAKAEWEKRLYQRAICAAETMAAMKPAGWLEQKLVELDEAFMAGDFSFFAETSLKLLRKPGGLEILLSILTGKDLAELAPLLVAKGTEVKALLHLILKDSFPALQLAESQEPKK